MIIAFFLKILCDISYYMCFAAFIGSFFGVRPVLLPYALLLSICAALSMALDSRAKHQFLRFIPIPISAAGILLTWNIPTVILLLPPFFYTAYICYKRYFCPDHYHYVASFKPLVLILGVTVAFIIFFGGGDILLAYCIPYIMLYILCSVILMRTLRNSERTMMHPTFILMNTASIAVVCLLSILMSTDIGLKIIEVAILILYRIVAAPLMLVFAYVIAPILELIYWIIMKLLSLIPGSSIMEPESNGNGNIIEQLRQRLIIQLPKEFIYILLALCVAGLVISIFRTLLSRNRYDKKKVSSSSSYEYISVPAKKPLSFSLFFTTNPTEQVRFYYRKLLMFFLKQGLKITEYMDTSEIEKQAFYLKPEKKDLIKRIRLIYQPARYGKGADKQAAKEAKDLYYAIKKASR